MSSIREHINLVENMGYMRVLPRDLFNEANLLKCMGKLWLLVENSDVARFQEDSVPSFQITMDDSNGGISVSNLTFEVRGEVYDLYRPMNSRRSWPLFLVTHDYDEIDVFTEAGVFSPDMIAFLKGDDEDNSADLA